MTTDRELKALRLVSHLITLGWKPDEEALDDQDVLREAADLALKNKVFLAFYEGLTKVKGDIPDYVNGIAERQLKRKRVYANVLKEFVDIAERNDINFLVFKTVKPFTYIGDDVDVLLPSTREFDLLAGVLEDHGYHFIGSGPPEATFLKRVDGVNVYVDAHKKLSASYIPYVDENRVWACRMKAGLYGCGVYVPSPVYDILIVAGHSLMKEFRINLAEFYHALLSLNKVNWNKLCEAASIENMSLAFNIFMNTVKQLFNAIYGSPTSQCIRLPMHSFPTAIAERILCRDLTRNFGMPYSYHIALPFMAYVDKLRDGLASETGSFPLLLSILRAPFTNVYGIKVLTNYLRQSVKR